MTIDLHAFANMVTVMIINTTTAIYLYRRPLCHKIMFITFMVFY
jgi:hypothetical protein